jgi:putative DNA primase/helicase
MDDAAAGDAAARVRALMDAPQDVTVPPDLVPPDLVPPSGGAPAVGSDMAGGPDGAMDPGDPGPEFDRGGPGGEPEAGPPAEFCAGLPLNDYGNGRRLVRHFGRDLIWVPRVGWFHWTGQVWERDPDEIAVKLRAQAMGALMAEETRYLRLSSADEAALEAAQAAEVDIEALEAIPGRDRTADQVRALSDLRRVVNEGRARAARNKSTIGERLTFAKTSGNTDRQRNMVTEAGAMLARSLADLDAAPMDINTEAGVLRFSVSGGPGEGFSAVADCRLIPHDRALLMTKMMPVVYDPAARCPLFDAQLARVQPDPQMRGFLQRWFGLSMTALTREQKLVFLHGGGRNMKSVLVELIARMMGGYAAKAKIESLTGKNRRGGGDATPDLMPLMGARLVRASEPEEGERLQEGMIKELTGGERFMVRALHTDFIEVDPLFKLTILGNHRPDIRGTDDGIWRRLLLVPFDVQIPVAETDVHLSEKLWAERSGILNWLVAGLCDYLEGGLREPARVLDATAEYREESDPIRAFLESVCVVTGETQDIVTSKDLGEAFQYWQIQQGGQSWGMNTISRRLKEKSKRWRSAATGQKFGAVKASTMKYQGIRYTEAFGLEWANLPRDAQGRVLGGRVAASPPGTSPEGFEL